MMTKTQTPREMATQVAKTISMIEKARKPIRETKKEVTAIIDAIDKIKPLVLCEMIDQGENNEARQIVQSALNSTKTMFLGVLEQNKKKFDDCIYSVCKDTGADVKHVLTVLGREGANAKSAKDEC